MANFTIIIVIDYKAVKWQVFALLASTPLFSQTIEVTQLIESGKNHWIFHDFWSADQ